MKKLYIPIMFSASLLCSGCVQTMYHKSIEVTKDANGNILQIVEVETVSQPGQGWPIKLEKLKGVQP